MLITIQQFFDKWNYRAIDFDHYYGPQCVDLFRQYVQEVLGIPQAPPVDGASDLWNNYNPQYYDRINNGLFDVPKKGDVPIWNTKVGGGHGHISVVESANLLTFKSFDQNWPVGTYSHFQTHNYTNIYGWLRPKFIIVPAPPATPGDDVLLNNIMSIGNGTGEPREKIAKIREVLKT